MHGPKIPGFTCRIFLLTVAVLHRLVGGIPTPLKNMKVSWDSGMIIPKIWENHPVMFQSPPTSRGHPRIPMKFGTFFFSGAKLPAPGYLPAVATYPAILLWPVPKQETDKTNGENLSENIIYVLLDTFSYLFLGTFIWLVLKCFAWDTRCMSYFLPSNFKSCRLISCFSARLTKDSDAPQACGSFAERTPLTIRKYLRTDRRPHKNHLVGGFNPLKNTSQLG